MRLLRSGATTGKTASPCAVWPDSAWFVVHGQFPSLDASTGTAMRKHLLALALLPLLAACGEKPVPAAAANGAMPGVAEAAASNAPASAQALQPGQSVQGVIEADAGNGMRPFRSLSTKVADDIARQVDARLATREGEQALADANRSLSESGIKADVKADQVRDLIGGMAGKTFHDSSIQHVGMVHALNASLGGTAADGAKVTIELQFDDATLELAEAKVYYQPAGMRSPFDRYQSSKEAPARVTIERFEKNADDSYRLVGSFTAGNLPATRMAKKLAGSTLASISGRFAFDALPARELKIGGR